MNQNISSLIWGIADDVLRGTFKPNEYGRIILPFVVLRRLDCVLEKDKKQAIEIYNSLKDSIDNPEPAVLNKLKLNFYNISNYDLENLKSDPTNIKQNFENYIQGYSENVQDIVKNFNLQPLVDKLDENDKLFLLIDKYTTVDLHPDTIDNHQMGTIYEELLRKFSEMTNEESGDHFTPRDIVKLLVTLVFGPDKDNLQGKGLIRTIYDPCCGTGGLLSIGKQWVKENINPDISIELFGQELNDQTYAVCKSDHLISGENPENIHGPHSTLTKDQLKENKFDYIIANPPYGTKWNSEQEQINREFEEGDSIFKGGLPRVSDASFLFIQLMVSKMNENSRVGIILNASPLSTGSYNSSENKIREWLFKQDLVESIIQLPNSLFYNTPLKTYIWILNKNKNSERKNKLQLIDASENYEKLVKNLNNKTKEISDNLIGEIYEEYINFKETEKSKILDYEDISYNVYKLEIQGSTNRKHIEFVNNKISKEDYFSLAHDVFGKENCKVTDLKKNYWVIYFNYFFYKKLPSINESNIHQKANEFIKKITKEINTIYDK